MAASTPDESKNVPKPNRVLAFPGALSDMSAVLSAATKRVYTSPLALKWSSGALKEGELPQELVSNRTYLAIYLLPRAFASLNMPMASEFAELWQFGNSKQHKIEFVPLADSKAPSAICRFRQSEFSGSETLKSVVRSMLDKGISTLPQMAKVTEVNEERWSALRRIAVDTAKSKAGEDVWNKLVSFEGRLDHPDILLEYRGPSTDTFISNGEWPLSSDCYGAIGPFAARCYLEATISKKAGDDRIFVKPIRVGVRIWDDYNFVDGLDSFVQKALSAVLGRLSSQFLGFWHDKENSLETIDLRNVDFRDFRKHFMPLYNSQNPEPRRKMICQDYSAVSDFAVRMVELANEYVLPGIKAS